MQIRTLVITPTFDVLRADASDTTEISFDNGGATQVFDKNVRPKYRFQVTLDPIHRIETEPLQAFYALHRNARSFFWDGGPYQRVENYVVIAEGDGVSRQFFLPNRWIGTGSLAVQTQNFLTAATSQWSTGAYSLNATPGIITFNNSSNTIPASGDDIMAKWANKYRVRFIPPGVEWAEHRHNLFKTQFSLVEVDIFT